jgi:AP-2 complex subunit alpha
VREPNIRYLGLETMARMARIGGTLETIKKHQASIQFSLKDGDISIRKRALDLLYTMCDETNAREIVDELIKYLETADYAIREELVLKIAILGERFSPEGDKKWCVLSLQSVSPIDPCPRLLTRSVMPFLSASSPPSICARYVNTVLKLIALAGAHVSDDIWYRVVQIVTNNEQLHAYAANAVLAALRTPGAHETAVKVGGYILGEFGHLLKEEGVAGAAIFEALHRRFATASLATRALLLSSYMKLLNMFPELHASILPVFAAHGESIDSELQQRAIECVQLFLNCSFARFLCSIGLILSLLPPIVPHPCPGTRALSTAPTRRSSSTCGK